MSDSSSTTDQPCTDWKAWLDRMPGVEPTLYVTCTCGFPSTGYSAKLKPHHPQGTNPRDLLLELHVHEPDGITNPIMTELSVQYSEPTADGYDTVSIVPDGPVGIPVDIVS